MHVRAAPRNGLTPAEINEVLLQVASTRVGEPRSWPLPCPQSVEFPYPGV